MFRVRTPTALLVLALCAACGESASGDGVGGVSAGEARALNEAADMLDKRPAAPIGNGSARIPAATTGSAP